MLTKALLYSFPLLLLFGTLFSICSQTSFYLIVSNNWVRVAKEGGWPHLPPEALWGPLEEFAMARVTAGPSVSGSLCCLPAPVQLGSSLTTILKPWSLASISDDQALCIMWPQLPESHRGSQTAKLACVLPSCTSSEPVRYDYLKTRSTRVLFSAMQVEHL